MRVLLAALASAAVVLAPSASTTPALAAEAGYHALYYTENVEFIDAAPGDTRQFIVGFTNTGDRAWWKGVANQQAALATAVPLDNRRDYDAGWASRWLAPSRYAAQDDLVIQTGRVGYFTYSVVVPPTAPYGRHYFYGRPVIDGVGPMEDYGYYQGVNLPGRVHITGSTPAGPSPTASPTLTGAGATPGESVTIIDGPGGPTVGSGAADRDGKFTIALTQALADGTHALVPSTPSQGSGAGLTYTMDSTLPPSLASVTTARTLDAITVTFNKPMVCASATRLNDLRRAADFVIEQTGGSGQAPTVNSSTPSGDCVSTDLLLSARLVAGGTYTLRVVNVQDVAGRSLVAPDSLAIPTAVDTVAPKVVWVNAVSTDGAIVVVFSESMNTTEGPTGSVINPSNYTLDGVALSDVAIASCQSVGCTIVKLAFSTIGAAGPLGAAGSTHTLTVWRVSDLAGNVIAPHPSANDFITK